MDGNKKEEKWLVVVAYSWDEPEVFEADSLEAAKKYVIGDISEEARIQEEENGNEIMKRMVENGGAYAVLRVRYAATRGEGAIEWNVVQPAGRIGKDGKIEKS